MIKPGCLKISFAKIVAAGILAATVASCNPLKRDYVACPDIRISDQAEGGFLEGANLGQVVHIRVISADIKCVATDEGHDLDIELGFLMRRDISDNGLPEEIIIDVTFAYLDADDNVVSRYVYSDDVAFRENRDTGRPILVFSVDIPADTRVVMGIGKAIGGEEEETRRWWLF
jgi:hypothetical protein